MSSSKTIDEFKIKIPASSSNLGPGFDCFGLALDIYNEYSVQVKDSTKDFKISSNLTEKFCPQTKENLFYQAYSSLFEEDRSSLELHLDAGIPCAGGFGSSGTAVLAGLLCANKVLGDKYSQEEIALKASLAEGHPDNVLASLMGGFCLSYLDGDLTYKKLDWKLDLDVLMLFPLDFRVNTDEARAALSESYTLKSCVKNLANASLFTAAVLEKDLDLFVKSIKDDLHQEARLKLIPGASEIIELCYKHGAVAATISGSGASLIAFVNPKTDISKIQSEAKSIWQKHGLESDSILSKVSNSGALIY